MAVEPDQRKGGGEWRTLERYLPPRVAAALADAARWLAGPWEEVRLRLLQPVAVVTPGGEVVLRGAPAVSAEDLETALSLVTGSSLYACEEEIRQGFLALPGGHRVGVCGRAVSEGGRLRTIRDVTSLNFRLARAVPGAADAALPFLVEQGRLLSTLVFSPPGAGKTTFLRDLARQVSLGRRDLGLPPRRVAVLDERQELAGGYPPSFDLGPRTDVLAGCPRDAGLPVLLRSMSPEVLVTDELGHPGDVEAVAECLRCGVAVVASAHAGSLEELRERPSLRALLEAGAFARFVQLGRAGRAGTLVGVWDRSGRQPRRREGEGPVGDLHHTAEGSPVVRAS